jgi:hypothetical protein
VQTNKVDKMKILLIYARSKKDPLDTTNKDLMYTCALCHKLCNDGSIAYDDSCFGMNPLVACGAQTPCWDENGWSPYLICPHKDDIETLPQLTEKAPHKCAQALTFSEAREQFPDAFKADVCSRMENDEKYVWLYISVGVLRITHFAEGAGDEEDDNDDRSTVEDKYYHNVSAMHLNEIPKHIDTSHDGVKRYYKAKCTECETVWAGSFSGD